MLRPSLLPVAIGEEAGEGQASSCHSRAAACSSALISDHDEEITNFGYVKLFLVPLDSVAEPGCSTCSHDFLNRKSG